MGRPLKFKSVEELQNKIDDYFSECDRKEPLLSKDGEPIIYKGMPLYSKEQTPYTLSDLASAIGFSNYKALWSFYYRQVEKTNSLANDILLGELLDKQEFRDCITRAIARVEAFQERSLYDKNTVNGAKFIMACNGWNDGKTVDITIKNGNVASPEDAIKSLEALGFKAPTDAKSDKTHKNTDDNCINMHNKDGE